MKDQFHIVLPSNSSMSYFANRFAESHSTLDSRDKGKKF